MTKKDLSNFNKELIKKGVAKSSCCHNTCLRIGNVRNQNVFNVIPYQNRLFVYNVMFKTHNICA